VEDARRHARQVAAICERGEDPREKLRSDVPVVTLEMAYATFLKLKKLRPSTKASYQSEYTTYLTCWAKRDITRITADDLYDAYLKAESRVTAREAMKLFNNIFTTVAPVFKHHRKRILTYNPFQEFKASVGRQWKRVRKRKQPIITITDLGKVIATLEKLIADQETFPGERRHFQVFLISLFTGLRFGEAAKLEWPRVDFHTGMLTIEGEHAKNHHEHTVYMHGYVVNLLRGIWRTRTVMSPWVFPRTRSVDKPITKRSDVFRKLEGIWGFRYTSHANRRTFSSAGEKIGLPFLLTKRMLNHLYKGDITELYIDPEFDPSEYRNGFVRIGDFLVHKRDEYLTRLRRRVS
jgi:integrase